MAIFISRCNQFFHPSIPHLTYRNSTPSKNNKWVCFASSQQLNPVGSEVFFCVGTHLIPHPNKIARGGEDAFFVSSYSGGVVAVADGVSGWAEQNVDPSLFPRELMANASCLVGDEEVNYDPQILVRKAHAATSSTGSATVIVAMLERNGMLKVANVGDCGLRVIRGGRIIFSTSAQEHYFDCPYQLSSETVGQTYVDAMVSSLELREGDAIVMGSDGLFDNVFGEEIVSMIDRHNDVAEAAKALANLARMHSLDSQFDSPYALEARSKGFDVPLWKKIIGMKLTGMFLFHTMLLHTCSNDDGRWLAGGKLDDITVIVGRVIRSGEYEDGSCSGDPFLPSSTPKYEIN